MGVRGSKTGRSVMKVLDLLGRRWSLRVLWELRHGPLTFRALRTACGEVSPTSLNQRLSELRGLGVVEAADTGYQLTATGKSLSQIVLALHGWAERHARLAPGHGRGGRPVHYPSASEPA